MSSVQIGSVAPTPPAELTSVANVLVVEDEMVLRMRAVDIVEDAGFAAVEAVNADEALAILESRSDISLLFSDIQMPGSMNGLKLAHAVHERWPSIKIILVSGEVDVADADKPAELQGMVGAGALTIVPTADEMLFHAATQDFLAAENGSLRLLLEQAGIDAKALLAQAGIDAREREAADKLQKLILGELHHRIKNTLATVSAIAAQSLRTATSIEHGQQAIESRLIALGRAHDLLMQVSWANSSLMNTVRGATEPYAGQGTGRFSIEGPDIDITSGAVIALAMTLNELCTNTTKFGALSVPAGRIDIAWTIDDKTQRLRMTWTEKGGPAVNAPSRRSFGTRMVGSLGKQLNGDVQLNYEPSGFLYVLEVPLSSLTVKA
jgi:two-component sensor histidine kinase/CheY-like chemotaxis protein